MRTQPWFMLDLSTYLNNVYKQLLIILICQFEMENKNSNKIHQLGGKYKNSQPPTARHEKE